MSRFEILLRGGPLDGIKPSGKTIWDNIVYLGNNEKDRKGRHIYYKYARTFKMRAGRVVYQFIEKVTL